MKQSEWSFSGHCCSCSRYAGVAECEFEDGNEKAKGAVRKMLLVNEYETDFGARCARFSAALTLAPDTSRTP